jgi:hypothetical protein
MAEAQKQNNEGEGNRTAARAHNESQRRFVKSGQVEKPAREAEQALDGPEARELAEAEALGKSHIAEEDPQVSRDYHAEIARRAHEIWEAEGRPLGRDREHWQQAEAEIRTSEV